MFFSAFASESLDDDTEEEEEETATNELFFNLDCFHDERTWTQGHAAANTAGHAAANTAGDGGGGAGAGDDAGAADELSGELADAMMDSVIWEQQNVAAGAGVSTSLDADRTVPKPVLPRKSSSGPMYTGVHYRAGGGDDVDECSVSFDGRGRRDDGREGVTKVDDLEEEFTILDSPGMGIGVSDV